MMKLFVILLCALPLSLAGSSEGGSDSENPLQAAIRRHGEHVDTVLKMARDGKLINGVLLPLSFLSSGGAGFVFKGMRWKDAKPVAIKFVNKKKKARKEFQIYSYLNAINNTEAEKYGIPTVYYYGRWNGLIVTAYTKLEKTLGDLQYSVEYFRSDILLLMKQFIKQSKYIHSRGVRHNDIKPENILTQGCGSFLIDFDIASKMAKENRGTIYPYASLRYHQGVKRVATDDWESFLYTICEMADITLDWFKEDLTNGTAIEKEDLLKLYEKLKANREGILEVINRSGQGDFKPIIPIVHAFAKEALTEKLTPNYDHLDKLVTDALAKDFPTITCFSWASPIRDESITNINISDLVIPDDFSKYDNFNYPEVNDEFFQMDDVIGKAIERHGEPVNTVLEMAKAGKSINDVLRPLGLLSSSDTGFVFRGIRLEDDAPVAIKFFGEESTDAVRREYEMYSYLNAINNTEVEKYGISTVYYYGRWEGFIVMVHTELGKTLHDHMTSTSSRYFDYDILLVIQQFIKQSKYMHSCGIRHDDIKPQNILIRGCESFLIDFKHASKMVFDNRKTTKRYAPFRYHQGLNRVATNDWESFLYAICEMCGIILNWFTLHSEEDDENNMKVIGYFKANRPKIRSIIDQSDTKILKPILRAFADEALSKKSIPDYDHLDQLLTHVLKEHFPGKTCFSWAKPTRARSVINNILSGLAIPDDFSKYKDFKYPEVDEEFFNEK